MSAELTRRLHDALHACDEAQAFVGDLTFATYLERSMVRSAVERQLEITGEALNHASRLDPKLASRVPELSRVVGMRNRLIHGYDRVDDELIWDAVKYRIPALRARLQALLDSSEPTSCGASAHDDGQP